MNRDEDGWYVTCWQCGEVGPLAPKAMEARQLAKEAGFSRRYVKSKERFQCSGCRDPRTAHERVLEAVTEPMTAEEVAAKLHVSTATAASALVVLNRRGLVHRGLSYYPLANREQEAS